ncbi:hypothetical protein PR048_025644 [Dryococelus australis]|uniref:DDE Tnp4 domain-containing protein n=1 Tax=Dryococelus australis TaxID=614101 RepID=A0ABQ9GRY2_9NEOP|nr:hypothetical protein PR048_025644 [Dryococelus australis]
MYIEKGQTVGTHSVLSSRLSKGQFYLMFQQHRMYEEKLFLYNRMSVASFNYLFGIECDHIRKNDTVMINVMFITLIDVTLLHDQGQLSTLRLMRLMTLKLEKVVDSVEMEYRYLQHHWFVCFMYLTSGMSLGDIEFDFHVSWTIVRLIVRETCEVIWELLHPLEIPSPNEDMWREKAHGLEEFTNYSNCVGAVNCKHILHKILDDSISTIRNVFLLVLLAVSDGKYNFTAIDVGAYGREGDSTIFKISYFYRRLKTQQRYLPKYTPLPSFGPTVPFVRLGDEAFGLSKHAMRPYGQKDLTKVKRKDVQLQAFRARCSEECDNNWCVPPHSCILVDKEFAIKAIQCCCVLHNFEDSLTCDMEEAQGAVPVGRRTDDLHVREFHCAYFYGLGTISCQESTDRHSRLLSHDHASRYESIVNRHSRKSLFHGWGSGYLDQVTR